MSVSSTVCEQESLIIRRKLSAFFPFSLSPLVVVIFISVAGFRGGEKWGYCFGGHSTSSLMTDDFGGFWAIFHHQWAHRVLFSTLAGWWCETGFPIRLYIFRSCKRHTRDYQQRRSKWSRRGRHDNAVCPAADNSRVTLIFFFFFFLPSSFPSLPSFYSAFDETVILFIPLRTWRKRANDPPLQSRTQLRFFSSSLFFIHPNFFFQGKKKRRNKSSSSSFLLMRVLFIIPNRILWRVLTYSN